jgi:hypothetical protein
MEPAFGRKSTGPMGFIMSLLVFAAEPALAAAPVTSTFTGIGSGLSSGATSDCSECTSGHTCICVPITGAGKANLIGNVTFSTVFVIDETNTAAGECADTYGTLTLTQKTNSGNTLIIDYHGFTCSVASDMESVDGTYAIDGADSTGKFVGYNGSGNMGGTENISTGAILGYLNGTIQTP